MALQLGAYRYPGAGQPVASRVDELEDYLPVMLSGSEESRLLRAEILRYTRDDKLANIRLECSDSVKMTK